MDNRYIVMSYCIAAAAIALLVSCNPAVEEICPMDAGADAGLDAGLSDGGTLAGWPDAGLYDHGPVHYCNDAGSVAIDGGYSYFDCDPISLCSCQKDSDCVGSPLWKDISSAAECYCPSETPAYMNAATAKTREQEYEEFCGGVNDSTIFCGCALPLLPTVCRNGRCAVTRVW